MSTNLSSLKAALSSGHYEQARNLLSAYLKEDVSVTPSFLSPEPLDKGVCGPKVEASACAALLNGCLEGNSKDKCANDLAAIKDKLKNGIEGFNAELARRVCENLGIDIRDGGLAYANWIKKIDASTSDAEGKKAVATISANSELVLIIQSFIIAAQNPLVNPSSIAFIQKRILLSNNIIKPKTSRFVGGGQLGGGMRNNSYNRYVQHADSLRRLASMTGGSQPMLNETYNELANMYNSFVETLRNKGKQIEATDDARIRQLLSELKYTEERLQKVVLYIARYQQLQNNPDKEVKALLDNNEVSANLLTKLNEKYEKLKTTHKRRVFSLTSITDTLHQLLDENKELKDKIDAIGKPINTPIAIPSGLAVAAAPAPGPAPGAAAAAPAPGAAAAAAAAAVPGAAAGTRKYYNW